MPGVSQVNDNHFHKYCFPIFNRATYSRARELIRGLHEYGHDVTMVLSSSLLDPDYGLAKEYIATENPKIKIDLLETPKREPSHLGSCHQTADIIVSFSEYLSGKNYSAVWVIADRFETLGAAIASAYQNIPLIHVQGGEVTGNIDEKVRHCVTKLSDFHFTATTLAREYLKEMGEDPYRVYSVGCPSLDIISNNKIRRWRPKENYIICQFHPHTLEPSQVYKQTRQVCEAVIDWCRENHAHCYWFWPNSDPGREEVLRYLTKRHEEFNHVLIQAINKPPEDFLTQLAGARCIIGNSSCILREASYLGVPGINVGDRQGIRERSINVKDVEPEYEIIKKALSKQTNLTKFLKQKLYGDGRATQTILAVLSNKPAIALKGPLFYPLTPKYKEAHFGDTRFRQHATRFVRRKR